MKIYNSHYPPPFVPTDLSLSQFLTKYNPDGVKDDKVILEDDWSGKVATYGGLRIEAGKLASGLKARFEIEENTVVGVCGVNGVSFLLAVS